MDSPMTSPLLLMPVAVATASAPSAPIGVTESPDQMTAGLGSDWFGVLDELPTMTPASFRARASQNV